jgi:CHAT domain-containing protein/Flp pilus assembly protein TadD
MKSKATILLVFVLFSCTNLQKLHGQESDSEVIMLRIDSLHSVSLQLSDAGNVDEALALNREVETMVLERFGRESAVYGECRLFKGLICRLNGEFDKSIQLHLEALNIFEITLGKKHPNYATTLYGLGALYNYLSKYEKAEGYYLECKKIQEKTLGKKHPQYATILNNLGALYGEMGQYEKAEEYYLECKNIEEKTFGKKRPTYALTLNNLGNLYTSIRQYLKAEKYFLECKEIREKSLGKEHPDYSTSLNNLGALYNSIGQYEKAEKYFLECKKIREKSLGKEHPDYATSLNNLGALYNSIGQYEKAEKYFLECKEIEEKIFGKERPTYALTLNNLGALYRLMRQYEMAEEYYLECKEILIKTQGKDDPFYATTLNNLGTLYKSMGQYEKAERYILECLKIYDKSIGKEDPYYATTLNNLGALYRSTSQYEKAEMYFLESRERYEKVFGKDHPSYPKSRNQLGLLYQYMGQYEKAEPLIDTAMRAIQQNLRMSVQFLSEKDLGDYLLSENAMLQYITSFVSTGKFSTRMAGLAYDDALFQKGFLQTAARRLSTLTSANPEADSLSQLLASYRKRLSTEYTKPIAKRGAEVAAMENRANELESQLARVVAGYSEALKQVKWQEVQAALKPNEAAIEFLQFKVLLPDETDTVRYAALLLRPGMEAPMYINLCDERAIDSLMIRNIDRQVAYVSRLYAGSDFNRSAIDTSLQTSRAIKISTTNLGLEPSEGAESFRSLYELLWQPLEKHLKGVEVVYYANAGLMHRINLGAITIGKDSVLADCYKLVELGSTRSLALPEKTPEGNSNALVMGGIKYDSDSTALRTALFALDTISYTLRGGVRFYRNATDTTLAEYWEHLPFTSKEADGIGLLLQKSRIPSLVLKDYQATEEAFYKSVRLQGTSPRIIHLATHGYFLPDPESTDKELAGSTFRLSENPLIRSGLILAGGNQAWMTGQSASLGQEDGILTAYEISRLNLTGTELVVLSACETGLGDIQGNEGVYGLQRAFKIAGVRYVIMSLWQIPDEQSSLFMENFYQRWLEQGMSIPEAFRQTQTAMRQNKWSHHQWAGFVLLE